MFKFAQTLGDQLPASVVQPQAGVESGSKLVEMVRRALEKPLDYPPLAEAIFPGDQVAIAVHPDVPSGARVAQSVIEFLLTHGVAAHDLTLVTSRKMPVVFEDELADLNQVVHDQHDENAVSYLAANQAGQPVKINRNLFDADVVIPITCRDQPATLNDIYPEFSCAETIQRYHQQEDNEAEQRAEIRLANEHLGLFIALNVVGGPGDDVHSVLFGEKERTDQVAETLAQKIWRVMPQDPVPLVIATIEDQPENQTWDHFCRALMAAHDVSPGDGQMVICTDLEQLPDESMRQVLALSFEEEELAVVSPDIEGVRPAMQRLINILRERQVFLLSGLADEEVEEMGLGPISHADEFRRLVERADQAILLRDAHKVVVSHP